MEPDLNPFHLFSRDFHRNFWTSVILPRLRDEKKPQHSVFENHVPMEFLLATMICLMMAAIGIPRWMNEHSRLWALIALMGIGGLIYLLIRSIKSRSGEVFSFHSFSLPVFFFFIICGMASGLCLGFILKDLVLGLFSFFVGGALGYFAGILAGAVVMGIGWMGTLFVLFSIPMSLGMIVAGIMMLIALL